MKDGRGKKKAGIGKKILGALGVLLLAFVAAGFAFVMIYGPYMGIYLKRPSPKKYGEVALRFMENGYYAGTKEWQEAKGEALEKLKEAKSYEDTWPVLEAALVASGGKHSRLGKATGEEKEVMPEVGTCEGHPEILTLVIPECTLEGEKAKAYADLVLSFLSEHLDAKGVILDLRGNRGGDIAPMMGAVSPLLPDGDFLGIKMNTGQVRTLTLKEGEVAGGSGMKVDSFKLPEGLPIALLTDEETGSSGEALLLAFRGLPATRSFGAPTAGYASANTSFPLYDGARVVLTVGADVAMRTGEEFCEDPIAPDVFSENPKEDALEWILESVEG